MPTLPALTTQPSPAPVWAGTATPVADIVRPTDPEISQGWPLTAIPPSRQRFNWVLNRLSAGLRYIEQHGIGKWQVEEDYGEDSVVVHDHKLWVAKRANKGKIPPDNADDWDGIASMIAGPGGVDLTTIINTLIAKDVDLQTQIDKLESDVGSIPPPIDPPPIDWSQVPKIEDLSGHAGHPQTGISLTFPSGFRIRSRNFGDDLGTEDLGGGMALKKHYISGIIDLAGYGKTSMIMVTAVTGLMAGSGAGYLGPLTAWADVDVANMSATLYIHGPAAAVAAALPNWSIQSVT